MSANGKPKRRLSPVAVHPAETPIDTTTDTKNKGDSKTVTDTNNKGDSKKETTNKATTKTDNGENMEMKQMKCAYRPSGGNMVDSIPCCTRFHKKMGFKVFVFLMVLLLDLADLFSDWLLYRDVSATEEGLVYGPAGDSLRYSLLVFSIIGTLTFTFEVSNLWWEIFRQDPWVDVDLLSAITVWIEDVPQITINVIIVACREEAISYFQLVKASVIIVGAVIRIIVSLIRYCNKKSRHDLECYSVNPDSRRHVIYRIFIMIGLLLTLGGAVAIFLFTQSERNPNGSLNFKVPHSIIEGEYDDEKYFHNVSIYFSHELFDYDSTPNSVDDINLLRLLTINDIKDFGTDRIVTILYDNPNSGSQNSKVVVKVTDKSTEECFEIDRTNNKLIVGTNCGTFITAATAHEFVIKFHFTKANVPDLLFGDIRYNMMVKDGTSGACTPPGFTINSDVNAHAENVHVAVLHYYRNKGATADTFHVSHTSATEGQFYHSRDMQDISDVWKTGFAYCKSSGSMAPHQADSISVTC